MVMANKPTVEEVQEAWETLIEAEDMEHAAAWSAIMAERIRSGNLDPEKLVNNMDALRMAVHGLQGSFELLKAIYSGKKVLLVPEGQMTQELKDKLDL